MAKIARLSRLPPARKIEGAELQSWTNSDRLVYMFTRIDRKGDREKVTQFATQGKFQMGFFRGEEEFEVETPATVLLEELLILGFVEFRPLRTHAFDKETGKRSIVEGEPALFLTKAGRDHAFKLGFVYHGSVTFDRKDEGGRARWVANIGSSNTRWVPLDTKLLTYTKTKKGLVIALKNPRSNPYAVREMRSL